MRRLGLIGFGSIAEHAHLPALQSFPEIEVVAIADLSAERRERARQAAPQATLFESPDALIADGAVDCIDICTPPNTHAALMVEACARGVRDIVCEKPFVLRPEEYREVARARRESGTRIVSVDNWRYSHLNAAVTRLLSDGAIGEVREIVLRTGRPDHARGNDGWMPHWRTDRAFSGGGILLDHGWHQLYLLIGWAAGPVERVSAAMRTVDPRHAPVEDEVTLELEFPQARGRIELAWTSEERTNDGVVRGTDGEITIYDDRIVLHNGRIARDIPFSERLTQSSYHPEWFREVLQVGIIDKSGGVASRNFAEAGVLVSVINAAYESASRGGEPMTPASLSGAGEDLNRKDVYCSSGYPAT